MQIQVPPLMLNWGIVGIGRHSWLIPMEFDPPQSTESGYIMRFFLKVWRGQCRKCQAKTDTKILRGWGWGVDRRIDRLQQTRKEETIGRSRNGPSSTKNLVKQNRSLLMLFLAPKSRLFGFALAVDTVIIKLTILRRFKMGLALVTDGDSDQTVPFIASWQCVEAAGAGLGALDNGKRMGAGGIGLYYNIPS